MPGAAAWPRVRAVAYSYQNFTELPPASNRGQVIDRFQAFTGLDPKQGNPWCACFVYYAGYFGLFDPVTKHSAWPLPKTAGCAALGEFGAAHKILVATPEEGDVFLIWYAAKSRFAHTGFVIGKNTDGTFRTLEGNTSKPGDTNPETMREGWGAFERTRTFAEKDRFLNWTALLV